MINGICDFLYLFNGSQELSRHQSINQSNSIKQTSIAPISPAKPGSVARQPNQCSTAMSHQSQFDLQFLSCTIFAVVPQKSSVNGLKS